MKKNNIFKFIFYSLMAILVTSIGLGFFLPIWQAIWISIIIYLSLFVPGYLLSLAFFKDLDPLHRPIIAIVISIVVIPLIQYLEYLAGLKINLINYLFTLLGVIIISVIIILIRYVFHQKSR